MLITDLLNYFNIAFNEFIEPLTAGFPLHPSFYCYHFYNPNPRVTKNSCFPF
jgi:hypothetical protein